MVPVIGGFVLSGELFGFIFSWSPARQINCVLFGGALLFLSIISLKVWRQGKSSLPFILGQAGILLVCRKSFGLDGNR